MDTEDPGDYYGDDGHGGDDFGGDYYGDDFEDDGYLSPAALDAIERRGVTGYAN